MLVDSHGEKILFLQEFESGKENRCIHMDISMGGVKKASKEHTVLASEPAIFPMLYSYIKAGTALQLTQSLVLFFLSFSFSPATPLSTKFLITDYFSVVYQNFKSLNPQIQTSCLELSSVSSQWVLVQIPQGLFLTQILTPSSRFWLPLLSWPWTALVLLFLSEYFFSSCIIQLVSYLCHIFPIRL